MRFDFWLYYLCGGIERRIINEREAGRARGGKNNTSHSPSNTYQS